MENTSTFRQILSLLRYLFWLSVPVLLWLALRSLEFDRVLQTLTSLKLWQMGLLILSNSFIIFLLGLRWWLLIHRTHQDLAPLQMAGYWLAGFGVDYSTPAPGVGGEPLLAALLHERDGLEVSASIAAVAMDRLLDAMINAAVLLAFSLLVMRWQIFHHHIAVQAALVPAAIFILLAIVLFPLFSGHRPFHWLGQLLPEWIRESRVLQFLQESESRFAEMLNTQRLELLSASILTLIIWAAILAEFWLIVYFLGMRLNLQELITAVTASRLAFLFPLPAGLGALEASLVFAFRILGLKGELGLSAAIVIRVRDIIFIAVGLLWGGWLLGGWTNLWKTHRSSSADSTESALSDDDQEDLSE